MVRIIADSTCDLSPELVEKYGISIIPLYVRLGDKEYQDGVDITPKDLFKWSDDNGEPPKTSAPSIDDIKSFLYKDSNAEYIIFTISSTMSTSYSNSIHAVLDMEMEDRVHVVDSANLSTGIGHLVIRAAELAAQGLNGDKIVAEINELKPLVRASFVIDTLTYLYRGGRCSGLAAMFGSALKIHPRIAVVDGAMHPEKRYRGKNVKYVLEYVKDMENDLLKARKDRVFITYAGCDRKIVDSVREYLESLKHFDEILETQAGAVISSHCGPGTLGVLFIAQY